MTQLTPEAERVTEKFVRYSPGLERDDPNFEQNLQTVIDDMREQMRASPRQDGAGRVLAQRACHGLWPGPRRGGDPCGAA